MTKIEQKLRKIFDANKSLKVLYCFPDGNIFSDKNFALNHQRACKKDMELVHREDLPKVAEEKPKESVKKPKVADKKPKADTLSLRGQLASLDLEKPEGPMYKVYKDIRDGLGIKTADNKMATIVAALADEQKKLKSQKPE